jgi:hypothetical protein
MASSSLAAEDITGYRCIKVVCRRQIDEPVVIFDCDGTLNFCKLWWFPLLSLVSGATKFKLLFTAKLEDQLVQFYGWDWFSAGSGFK